MTVTGHLFRKTLRDQRRSLVGWSIGIVALVMVEGAIWPSIRDMPNFDELLESYPEGMKEVFGVEGMTTGVGFLNAELFTLVLPALFIIFGIARGARLVAGEEEAGTLEILLVTPLSTTRLVLEKAAALLVSVVLLGLVCASSTVLASAFFSMDVPLGSVAVGSLAMVLLGVEYGWLALTIGAATGRRAVALGTAGVAVVAAYVLYVAGLLVDEVSGWMPWSPFHQALADGPLDEALPARFGWLVLGAVVLLAAAPPIFARRDIRAA
jgi:ABC-2 type transport system permease protein